MRLIELFTPDTEDLKDFYEKGKFVMIWRLTMLFIVVFFSLGIIMLPLNGLPAVFYFTVCSIASFVLFYIHRYRKTLPVFWLFSIVATVLCQTSLFFLSNTVHYAEFLWILSTVIFTFITLNRKAGWFFLSVNALGLLFFVFGALNQHIVQLESQSTFDLFAIGLEIVFALFVFGYLMRQYLFFEQYNRLQLNNLNLNLEQQNKEIIAKNKENEILLKEVHHRVKNNLQIIVSLLRMQQSGIDSVETKLHFSEAISRVLTMSLIHQKLYKEKEPANIKINEYIQELTTEIMNATNCRQHITLCLDSEVDTLNMKVLVSFGLLLNELVSNSMKHAFNERERGRIHLELKYKDQKQLLFKYEDDGNWKEAEGKSGFGTELIDVLAEQLEGTYKRQNSTYTFELSTDDQGMG